MIQHGSGLLAGHALHFLSLEGRVQHDCQVIPSACMPAIVAEPPSKPNIKYILQHNPGTLEETFAEEVKHHRNLKMRTLMFSQT